jgi:protein involved in polysaccharide export with SLBB domain
MNLNQYTIKAQETIQAAQQLAYAGTNPTIETAHLLKALLNDQDSPVHYLMKRNNVNVRLLETKLAESLQKLPRITSGEPAQQVGRDLGNVFLKAVNNLKEFKDEFVSMEHLLLALLQVNDDVAAALKAAGLTEDAFTQRAYLTRLKADNTFELIAFDLSKVLNGGADDILLKREDQIQIASIFDLRDAYKITIDGAVRTPGELKFAENMALEDAIIQAGGFTESGFAKRIEVARRVKNDDDAKSAKTAEIFLIDVDPQLKFSKSQFSLQPFDIISVRNAPGFEEQRQVVLKGEVKYPGAYALSRKDERISDIIARAGGLSELAYPQGASLKRPGDQSSTKKDKYDATEEESNKLTLQKRLQKKINDTTQIDLAEEKALNIAVGIQLTKILNRPGSNLDLILEAGDTLSVPKKLQTVKVGGEVLSPLTVVYRSGKSLKTYVSEAGGISEKAKLKRSYVIQANGSVKSARRFFLLNFYPKVGPGAEIFVPARAERNKLSAQELLGITSGIASLGAVILGIINFTN